MFLVDQLKMAAFGSTRYIFCLIIRKRDWDADCLKWSRCSVKKQDTANSIWTAILITEMHWHFISIWVALSAHSMPDMKISRRIPAPLNLILNVECA